MTQDFVCKLKKGDPEFGYLYRIESEFKVLDLEFASLLAVTASFEAIVTSKRAKDDNGQPKDEVRVQFDVVVAMDVTVGWLITVGVDVPLDFHVDPDWEPVLRSRWPTPSCWSPRP